jgi:hypothetical protein|tara:strand:- start:20 stop:874 length:855 start_codon:yes stop_codon:yes gene_type:complete
MNVIYSIYIDIDEKNLDNPGWWENGVQIKTNKSLETKLAFLRNYEKLNQVKKDYAENIGADYILFENDNQYKDYFKSFKKNYPQISEYDVVNFYKQWLMLKMAEKYDNVCYLDFDVIPNTKEDIFKAHKIDTHFACAENNSLAVWGKIIDSNRYNTCIRNPASKYWNCHAMLFQEGYEPETDVFNTAIMVSSSKIINQLNYFGNFDETLKLMSFVKNDKNSIYPHNIKRVFGYDNETVFAYKRVVNEIEIDYITDDWHWRVDTDIWKEDAKMFHVMNKKFGLFL